MPYCWNMESILSDVHQAPHVIANKLQTIINQIWTMKELNCLYEKGPSPSFLPEVFYLRNVQFQM